MGRHVTSQFLELGPSKGVMDEACTAAALQSSRHASNMAAILEDASWPAPPGSDSSTSLFVGSAEALHEVWQAN